MSLDQQHTRQMDKSPRPEAPAEKLPYRAGAADTPTRAGRFFNHMSEDIRSSMFAELQLVFLTFCTGMQGGQRGTDGGVRA